MRMIVSLLAVSIVASIQLHAQPATKVSADKVQNARTKKITVNEGTNLAVTISPDHKMLLIDLQGMLYSLPVTGGKATQVTGPIVEASHPDFSSSGNLVAIQSYQGGTFHIWLMKPDGSGLRQLTTGHGDDREPRFSPDGKTIAFASDRAFTGSYDIWTVNVADGTLKQVTSGPDEEYEPTWSPDGKHLAFVDGVFVSGAPGVGGVQGRTIVSIDLGTNEQKVIAGDAKVSGKLESPSWSPDGRSLAYVQLVGAGAFSDSARLVVDGKALPGRYDDAFPFPAAWISPTELIYTANGHIVRTDLITHVEKQIPFTADIESYRPIYAHKHFDFDETQPHAVKGIFAPSLSPNGRSIAFVALNQLYILVVGDAIPKQITRDTFYKQGPAWSPDGQKLAYVSDKDGIENVYLLDLASGKERALSPSKSEAQIFPAWSPDGKWIAFQNQAGATLLANVESGSVKPLAPATFFPGRPSFSSDGKTVAIATVKPYSHRFREGTSSILTVDIATGKTEWSAPAPFESITTRTEDGPTYSPNGREIAFVMDDLLYTMPVNANGKPSGKAEQLNHETTDAPTWSGDGKQLLYLSNGKLRLIDRATSAITPVPLSLTWQQDKPTGQVLIHAARLWKGVGEEEQKDIDVLVTGNRIAWIATHNSRPVPGDARIIEAPNSTLLPGLWESHAHPNSDNSIYYGDRLGRLWMLYGITTLRDMADQAYRAVEEKESFLANTATGPRLFATGEAIDGERTYYPMMIPTTSEEQLHREFDRIKALDFDFMKLYVRLPYSWVVEGAKYAHSQMGVQTAGHYLLPAVALGNDGMSHVSATARTGYAYSRSLTGVSYGDVRAMTAESGMWTISTLLNQGVIAEMPSLADDLRYNVAPPWERERLMKARDVAIHTDQNSNIERVMREEATVRGVLSHGGMFVGGTDSPLDLPSTSLHLNLIAQVKYGLKPYQALETVTSIAARAAFLDKDLGTIEGGKLADLILVEGDPLTEIKDITKIQCVMKNGRIQSVAQIASPFVKLTTGDSVCAAQ